MCAPYPACVRMWVGWRSRALLFYSPPKRTFWVVVSPSVFIMESMSMYGVVTRDPKKGISILRNLTAGHSWTCQRIQTFFSREIFKLRPRRGVIKVLAAAFSLLVRYAGKNFTHAWLRIHTFLMCVRAFKRKQPPVVMCPKLNESISSCNLPLSERHLGAHARVLYACLC